MTLPKRWLEDDGTPSALRDVLRSDREMQPPPGADKAVWLALSAQVGVGAAAAAAKASASAAKATAAAGAKGATVAASGGMLKAILIGAFSGAVVMSGYTLITAPPSPPQSVPTARPAQPVSPEALPNALNTAETPTNPPAMEDPPSPEPVAPSSGPKGAPEPSPSEEPTGEISAPTSPEERASRLREESDLLRQARAALRSGDAAHAMSLLQQAQKKFPGGMLGQEREALTIEALAKSGARDAASARAAAFVAAHPTSPHAERLRAYVIAPASP